MTLLVLVLVIVLCHGVLGIMALSFAEDEEEWRRERGEEEEQQKSARRSEEKRWPWGGSSDDWFLLRDVKPVVKTDAGEMRVVKSLGGGGNLGIRNLHIGFITMEPQTLFIPQYLDSTLIIFIRGGKYKILALIIIINFFFLGGLFFFLVLSYGNKIVCIFWLQGKQNWDVYMVMI